MKTRLPLIVFLVAAAAVHVVLAHWSPIQGDDWLHWIWAGQHPDAGVWTWLTAHPMFSEAMGYLFSRCRVAYAIVSPLAFLALVVGMFSFAMRRLPRATGRDAFGVALASALVWMGQPLAGVTLLHAPNAASLVCGCAIAIWFAMPFRCGWNLSPRLIPLLVIAGYCTGTSTHMIAIAALVGVSVRLYRGPRTTWMWAAFGGLLAGSIVQYATPPWIAVARVFRRGIDPNLNLLTLPTALVGRVIAFVLLFVVIDRALDAFNRPSAPLDQRPSEVDAIRWIVGSFGMFVTWLLIPVYPQSMLLPATCMLIFAALPHLMWLASGRVIRYLLVATVVVTHLVAWSRGFAIYRDLSEQGAKWLSALEAGRPGDVLTMAPLSEKRTTYWELGEDLAVVKLREALAVDGLGLRDIKIEPTYRGMELDPEVQLAIEVEGVTDAQLAAAKPPAIWATELTAARAQFLHFARRLQRVAKNPVIRLRVANSHFIDPKAGRPLYAAWLDSDGLVVPRVSRSPLDDNSFNTIRVTGPDAKRFSEAYIVVRDKTTPTDYRKGSPKLRAFLAVPIETVVCNASKCLLADAFIPRL